MSQPRTSIRVKILGNAVTPGYGQAEMLPHTPDQNNKTPPRNYGKTSRKHAYMQTNETIGNMQILNTM